MSDHPLLSAALGSIIRWALMGGGTWLVERGVWTQAEASTYITGVSMALVSIGWSLCEKWQRHELSCSWWARRFGQDG